MASNPMSAPNVAPLAAGPGLDALVAQKVMGLVVAYYVRGERRIGFNPNATNYYETADGKHPDDIKRSDLRADWSWWSPSQDIAAAFQVVERMRELGWTVDVQGLGRHELLDGPDGNDQQWSARAVKVFESTEGDIEALAHTAPLAIARLALAAVEATHA